MSQRSFYSKNIEIQLYNTVHPLLYSNTDKIPHTVIATFVYIPYVNNSAHECVLLKIAVYIYTEIT